MLAPQAGALILGLAVVGLLFLLEHPEDLGSVSPGWLRRHRGGK